MSNVSSSNSHKALAPKLRFTAFNKEWEQTELGNVATINPKSAYLPDTFLYIDLESVVKGELVKNTIIDKCNAPSRAQRVVAENDILFQTVRPYQQNNYFFAKQNTLPTVASTGYAQIRTVYNPYFLYTLLHTKRFLDEVIMRCTGSGYPAINSNDLGEIEICLPEINEQTKIAELFSIIDKRLIKQRQLIELLKSYKRGFLHDIFTQKIKITYEENWTEISLGEIAKIYQPQTISTDQLDENFPYPVYGANGLIGYYSRFNHDTEQIAICCRGASCGTVNYIPAKSWITGNAMVINIQSKEVDKKFIYYQLLASDLSYMISGSGQPQIVRKPCEEHKILLPSFNTQIAISNLCNKIDLNINANSVILEKMIETKSALLQRLFI